MNYRTAWSSCKLAPLLSLLLCASASPQAARSLYWQPLQVDFELGQLVSEHIYLK
jgi:hypothetical protein